MESNKPIQNKFLFLCKLKMCPISHKYVMANFLYILSYTHNILYSKHLFSCTWYLGRMDYR